MNAFGPPAQRSVNELDENRQLDSPSPNFSVAPFSENTSQVDPPSPVFALLRNPRTSFAQGPTATLQTSHDLPHIDVSASSDSSTASVDSPFHSPNFNLDSPSFGASQSHPFPPGFGTYDDRNGTEEEVKRLTEQTKEVILDVLRKANSISEIPQKISCYDKETTIMFVVDLKKIVARPASVICKQQTSIFLFKVFSRAVKFHWLSDVGLALTKVFSMKWMLRLKG